MWNRNYKRLLGLLILVQCTLASCTGGYVTKNGLFEDGHQQLKEALVGKWRVVRQEGAFLGEEKYMFYQSKKDLKLEVNGLETEIERFDSQDGLSFTFQYDNVNDERILVVGQFRSFDMKILMIIEEPDFNSPKSLQASLTMENRPMSGELLVVRMGN